MQLKNLSILHKWSKTWIHDDFNLTDIQLLRISKQQDLPGEQVGQSPPELHYKSPEELECVKLTLLMDLS
jgi:hypothetical protein